MTIAWLGAVLVALVYVLATFLVLALVGWAVFLFVSFLLRDMHAHLSELFVKDDAGSIRDERGLRP
jgi:cobalamin biosynthesis protein CobD/CbiB